MTWPGMAVKLAELPVQRLVEGVVMLTETVCCVVTFMVTTLDVAGLLVAQLCNDVRMQRTWSPLSGT